MELLAALVYITAFCAAVALFVRGFSLMLSAERYFEAKARLVEMEITKRESTE